MRPSPLESTLYAVALVALAWSALEDGARPAFEPGPRRPGTYRTVTWNVGGLGPDGPTGFDDAAIESVAGALNELQPDLVLLQEIGSREQLRRLRDALGGDWDLTIERDHERGRVAALGRGALTRIAVDAGPRCLGLVHASPLGTDVYVVGLHADPFDARARNAEVGAAFDALRALPRPIPRLLMAVLLGVCISAPLEIRILKPESDAQLELEQNEYLAQLNRHTEERFATAKAELRDKVAAAQARLDERESYFERRRMEINQQRRSLELEAEGGTASGRPGRGPAWRDKKDTLD